MLMLTGCSRILPTGYLSNNYTGISLKLKSTISTSQAFFQKEHPNVHKISVWMRNCL